MVDDLSRQQNGKMTAYFWRFDDLDDDDLDDFDMLVQKKRKSIFNTILIRFYYLNQYFGIINYCYLKLILSGVMQQLQMFVWVQDYPEYCAHPCDQ